VYSADRGIPGAFLEIHLHGRTGNSFYTGNRKDLKEIKRPASAGLNNIHLIFHRVQWFFK